MSTLGVLLVIASLLWGGFPQGSVPRGPIESVLSRALERTASHNLEVARFYIKKQKWVAARGRLQDIVKDYPEFSRIDEVYYLLGEVYRSTDDRELAIELYSRLVEGFPQSGFSGRARDRLRALGVREKG